jgi:hypothetical protein
MSTTDSYTRSELEALVRALIEEARQRARRRRRIYGGVLISTAVICTIVFASFQRSAQSQSTSPAFTAGTSLPSHRIAANEHSGHGWFPSKGKRGSFTVELRTTSSGTLPIKRTRSWWFGSLYPQAPMTTGQYAQVTGGGGRLSSGGHQAGWYARLFGVVSRHGGAKQRVLITLKGRPNGVFVLTPLEPGVLERDSGTQHSFGTGERALTGTRQQPV